jgi:pimeloyl-ACP methyl ester carboxylesterase
MTGPAASYKNYTTHLSNGIEISYCDEGKGAMTLLFIHGLGSNKKCWRKNIEVVKHQFRCIAIDLPGYGASSKGDYSYDMAFFATVVRDFAQQLHLDRIVLVGHSMGGQIAVTAQLQAPGFAEQLVLIAPAGFETFNHTEKQIVRSFYSPALLMALPQDQIRRNFEINFYVFPRDAEFMIQDRFRMQETDEYERYCKMIPKCVMGMIDQPIFDSLPSINVPTSVIYGKNDRLIPNKLLHPTQSTPSVAQAGTSQISDAQLILLDQCGHFVQWERPDEVNRHLLNHVLVA